MRLGPLAGAGCSRPSATLLRSLTTHAAALQARAAAHLGGRAGGLGRSPLGRLRAASGLAADAERRPTARAPPHPAEHVGDQPLGRHLAPSSGRPQASGQPGARSSGATRRVCSGGRQTEVGGPGGGNLALALRTPVTAYRAPRSAQVGPFIGIAGLLMVCVPGICGLLVLVGLKRRLNISGTPGPAAPPCRTCAPGPPRPSS